MVYESLQSGEFPDDLKDALVKPLLKKITLELVNRNYRPLSNLLFMVKLVDRCVMDQLMDHIHSNNLMESLQSAYRPCHSMETPLLKVKRGILKAMDTQEITCLELLDLLAAVDTVDNSILLNCLENYFGIKGTALWWIESYLTNWTQKSGDWKYEHNRCHIGKQESKFWCTARQCVRSDLVHSLHFSTWSNMCQTHSLPSLCR